MLKQVVFCLALFSISASAENIFLYDYLIAGATLVANSNINQEPDNHRSRSKLQAQIQALHNDIVKLRYNNTLTRQQKLEEQRKLITKIKVLKRKLMQSSTPSILPPVATGHSHKLSHWRSS